MILRPALLVLALAAPGLAWGQSVYPAERIARLSYVEGDVSFRAAGERATDNLPDRPLIPGDRLMTESGGRAELALGNATIRLDEQTDFAIVDLDAETTRVELMNGSANVYVNELLEGETLEILTPNATITLDAPGEYRADVYADDASALTVRQGAAFVDTAAGTVQVGAGQRMALEGQNALAHLEDEPPADAFDDWVLDREVRLADAEPRYTPFDDGEYDYDYEALDRYGEWYDEPRYGRVWMPSYGYSSWSPYYGGGYWRHDGYGYDWYDPAPFVFFTYYSGRWTYLHDRHRWCWVPAPRTRDWDIARHARDGRLAAVPRRSLPRRVTPVAAPRTTERRTVAMAPTNPSAPRRAVAERGAVRTRVDANDRRPARTRVEAVDERPRGGGVARGQDRERTPARQVATPSQRSPARQVATPSQRSPARQVATPSQREPSRQAAAPSRAQGGGARERSSRPEPARSHSKPEPRQDRHGPETRQTP